MKSLIRRLKKMLVENPYNVGFITGYNRAIKDIIEIIKKYERPKT